MAKELRSDNSLYLKITAKRNDTFRGSFVLYENGTPYDFTGYTARMQIKSSDTIETPILELTSGAGEISLSAEGLISFNVPYTSMIMPSKTYVYDLEVTGPTGVETIVYGDFDVTKDVTR